MDARFVCRIALLGIIPCIVASEGASAQSSEGTLPSITAFDPSAADSYRLLLAATARRVTSKEEGCGARCAAEALILSPAKRDPKNVMQLCFDNVLLQKFSSDDGTELRGAMTSVAVTAVDDNQRTAVTRRFRALLQVPAGEEVRGGLCAPTLIELSGRQFLVNRDPMEVSRLEAALRADEQVDGADLGLNRANATASIGGLLGGIIGGYSGAYAAAPDNSLLSRLFGYRSSRVIQLDLRSTPPGASIIVDGRETGLRTDSLVALAVRSLRNLRVRFGLREVPLERCTAVRRRSGVAAAYDCRLPR